MGKVRDSDARSTRGVKRRTRSSSPASQEIAEELSKEIAEKYGIEGFDPLRMLAHIGCEAMQPKVIETDGDTITVPPDRDLAMKAFSKMLPYLRPSLKAVEISGNEDKPLTVTAVDAKARLSALLGE